MKQSSPLVLLTLGRQPRGGMKESLQGSFACCRDSDRGVGRVAKAAGKEGIFDAHLEG